MYEFVIVAIEILAFLVTIGAAVLAFCFMIAGILWVCGVKV